MRSPVFVGPPHEDGRALLTSSDRAALDVIIDRLTDRPWLLAVDTEGYAYQVSSQGRKTAIILGAVTVSRQTITELAVAYTRPRPIPEEESSTNKREKRERACRKRNS